MNYLPTDDSHQKAAANFFNAVTSNFTVTLGVVDMF